MENLRKEREEGGIPLYPKKVAVFSREKGNFFHVEEGKNSPALLERCGVFKEGARMKVRNSYTCDEGGRRGRGRRLFLISLNPGRKGPALPIIRIEKGKAINLILRKRGRKEEEGRR